MNNNEKQRQAAMIVAFEKLQKIRNETDLLGVSIKVDPSLTDGNHKIKIRKKGLIVGVFSLDESLAWIDQERKVATHRSRLMRSILTPLEKMENFPHKEWKIEDIHLDTIHRDPISFSTPIEKIKMTHGVYFCQQHYEWCDADMERLRMDVESYLKKQELRISELLNMDGDLLVRERLGSRIGSHSSGCNSEMETSYMCGTKEIEFHEYRFLRSVRG